MTKRRIIYRADASIEIGLGHVTRLLALCDITKDHFECYFASRFFIHEVKMDVSKLCDGIISLPLDSSHYEVFLSHLVGDEIVVLDNYFFDSAYQKRIKELGCKIVYIDDLCKGEYYVDAIINHSPGFKRSEYNGATFTKYFLGLNFSILRKEFYCEFSSSPNNNSVFLCLGGADINNLSLLLLKYLHHALKGVKVNIVIGSANRNVDSIRNYAMRSKVNVEIHRNITAQKMVDLINCSAFCICPASGLAIEVLSQSKPLILCCTADNQTRAFQFLSELNGVYPIRDLNNTNEILKCIEQKNFQNPDVIDKEQPKRLLKVFMEL